MDKICAKCGKPLDISNSRRKYCSVECYRAGMKDAYYKSAIAMRGTSCGTSGAISELRAATDLMSKGYHVFRSLSPSCPCDLVILTDHHFLKVEVRSARENLKSGRIYKNKNHKKDNPHMIDMYAFVAQNKIVYEPPLPTISY